MESPEQSESVTQQQYDNLNAETDLDLQAVQRTKYDELKGYSKDDIHFLKMVIPPVRQRVDGMLEFPLPFREDTQPFPFNQTMAYQRTKSTVENMRKKHPTVFQSSIDKFAKNLEGPCPKFVPVPPKHRKNQYGAAYWIPIFSVWQKGKARLVFDSAAKFKDRCLNESLYQGPDGNNELRAVITRFRRHPYAATAAVENMFIPVSRGS